MTEQQIKEEILSCIEGLSKFKKQRELLINKNTIFTVLSRNGCLIELEVIV